MRKPFVLLLALAMIAALTACGAMEHKSIETTEALDAKIFTIIQAKDCFYDAGLVELIAGATESAEYTFTSGNSDAVEWCVYVFDQEFDDGFRYIKQAAEPSLVGDGRIFVDAGQYVYVYCSANEFTTGIVDENAKLTVTVKG